MKKRREILKAAVMGGLANVVQTVYSMGTKPLPASFRKLKGDVFLNGVKAHQNQVILEGDTVSTGPKSETTYVIGADAYLLRENSRVSYARDGVIPAMRVITGKVLSVFGPGEKRIKVPTATIGIRGTGCYIEATEELVYFCLCYGTADIVPLADPAQAQTIATQYHDNPFYIGKDKQSRTLMQRAPVINHTDFELVMLEYEVDRRPPFEPGEY